MSIASKMPSLSADKARTLILLAVAALMMSAFIYGQGAHAQQDALVVPPADATATAAEAATAPPMTAAEIAAAQPQPALVQPADPSAPAQPAAQAAAPAPASNGVAIPSQPVDLPEGAPASLGVVIKDLQASTNNISVDDMIRAQDALARLDLLVQIQRKVGELKKAQEDASGSTHDEAEPAGMQFANAAAPAIPGQIPASALSLPSAPAGGMAPSMATPAVIKKASEGDAVSSYTIERVSGANGNYSALVTTDDGESKLVRVGDKLGKSEVTNISAEGVQLRTAKGSIKTLAVENNGFALTPFSR